MHDICIENVLRNKPVQKSYGFFQTLFKKRTRAIGHSHVLYNKNPYRSSMQIVIYVFSLFFEYFMNYNLS